MSARYDPYPTSRSRYDQGIDSKIVIMGNSGVGKTSLLQRYIQNKFDPKNTTSTSGAFFVTKKVYVQGMKVRLQLWDTAGQERFRSMAPMYYRGANAALLLYDITNASTFDDIRGWLQELKKNCPPELIIYIVGSKADLYRHRQVSHDFARLSLHNWFPPPKPPSPPLSARSTSALSGIAGGMSYIRPRFTSFPGLKSATLQPTPEQYDQTPDYLDLPSASGSSNISRSRTSVTGSTSSRKRTMSSGLIRANTTNAIEASRYGSHFGSRAGGVVDDGDDGGETDQDEEEWGLSKGMELFEVSSKDGVGIQTLFDTLITAIIARKDKIEQENELRKRDSVMLSGESGSGTASWSAQADAEEAREKERSRQRWSSSCC